MKKTYVVLLTIALLPLSSVYITSVIADVEQNIIYSESSDGPNYGPHETIAYAYISRYLDRSIIAELICNEKGHRECLFS